METTDIKFIDAEYRPLLLQRMNSFRESKKLADIRLVIDGKEILAHKVIVGMWSPWIFDKLNENELIEMDYECGSYEAVSTIIDYMYTGEMRFSLENVVRICRNLDILQMHSVSAVLQEYLTQSINIGNCTEILLVADILHNEDLKNCALEYIAKNLKTLNTSRAFEHFEENLIKTIITASVGSNSAELIYQVVIDWLKFSEGRKVLIEEMLKFVNVDGISCPLLAFRISSEPYLKEQNSGRKWIVEKFSDGKYSIRPRKILNIFCCSPNNSIYEFNVDCNHLINCKQSMPNFEGFCIERHKTKIYALGPQSFTFDRVNKSWNELSCAFNKSSSGICLVGDQFYLIGGHPVGGTIFEKAVNCSVFDIKKGLLMPMCELKTSRCWPAVAVHNSSIYAIGGCYGVYSNNTIERFDPREGFWSKLKSIFTEGHQSAVSIANHIYFLAINGKMIEYDIRTRKESLSVGCPSVSRSLALLDGKLYLGHCGGIALFNFQDYGWTDLVETPLERPVLIA